MRTAKIDIVFPNADVNEVPEGFMTAVAEKAKEWGGTVISMIETRTTVQEEKLFDECS
tara:strand:+ start:101 stop:274 length:174 start_codon:yes stop_codon:yes gene_type:complete